MKGTIVNCLGELVSSKFGKDKWEQALEIAGLNKNAMFMVFADIDDAQVMKVVQSVCKVLNITLEQAADAFGDYWVNVYSQKLYGVEDHIIWRQFDNRQWRLSRNAK